MATSTHPSITVHWLEKSRSQRVLWLLKECHLPYEIKVYKRGPDHLAPPELKEIHPLGKAPVITIDRLVLAESGTIFEYIVKHFAPHLAPEQYLDGHETDEWLRYRYYMHYSEGSFMSLLMRLHVLEGLENADHVRNRTLRDVKTHLAFLESQIGSSPGEGEFLCGRELTAVDVLMCFPLQVVQKAMGGLSEFPKLEAYVARLVSRPAYKKAVEKVEEASGEEYGLV